MNVTKVQVSRDGILLSGGTGKFEIGAEHNSLSCGVFTVGRYPQQAVRYRVSFSYVGQRFEYDMACTLPGSTSFFVGPRTSEDPQE